MTRRRKLAAGAAVIALALGLFSGCGGSGESQHQQEVHRAIGLLEQMEEDLREGRSAHAHARHFASNIHLSHGAYFTTKQERQKARPWMERAEEQLALEKRKAAQVVQIERELMSFSSSVKKDAAERYRSGKQE